VAYVAFRDLTERNDVEAALREAHAQALAASQMKSHFVANMSHEIRTPLNGVVGMTELLRDTALTDEQSEYTDAIRASGDALLSVINDILDFSKIEAGKLAIEAATSTYAGPSRRCAPWWRRPPAPPAWRSSRRSTTRAPSWFAATRRGCGRC
jgi:signal transduction histidine kinase